MFEKFSVKMTTTNDAFKPDGLEIVRILRDIATKMEADDTLSCGKCLDINGHTVGTWEWK